MSDNIGFYGAGKWGSALEFSISENHKTIVSSRSKRDLHNFVDLDKLLECEYIVLSISSQHIYQWLCDSFVFNNQKLLIASKGIDKKSGKFLDEILENHIPKENLAYLSGPSFATEVQKQLPTALVINSFNLTLANKFKSFFPNWIKTYTSDDVIGAEIAGAYKNVLSIASGLCDGLGLGNNARASLISRGLVEMSRFGLFFGAKNETFLGLSGAGDLFLSASSNLSRNYRVGFGISLGKSLQSIALEIGEVAEGIDTAHAICKISNKYNIYTPIADEVKNILSGKNIKQSLKDLLNDGSNRGAEL
jgi:glycerol-3-phosphate dehydrogenase (NAD(P)+)